VIAGPAECPRGLENVLPQGLGRGRLRICGVPEMVRASLMWRRCSASLSPPGPCLGFLARNGYDMRLSCGAVVRCESRRKCINMPIRNPMASLAAAVLGEMFPPLKQSPKNELRCWSLQATRTLPNFPLLPIRLTSASEGSLDVVVGRGFAYRSALVKEREANSPDGLCVR